MKKSRLSIAIATEIVQLPQDGMIGVFGAVSDSNLQALPKDRCEIIQGFKPDYDALTAQGFSVRVDAGGPYSASIVILPRFKDAARQILFDAVQQTPSGLIIVDGNKTDGIDSFYKECRKRFDTSSAFSKAHGKVFSFTADSKAAMGLAPKTPADIDRFKTVPGVFSAGKIDRGSKVLIEALPDKLPKRIADLGAGWGYLSRHILTHSSVQELHLIEADYAALECAKENVSDARAVFHWADATRFEPDIPFDGIITNPPFHTSRKADPNIGRAFITAAASMLKPAGRIWLVANRHLPYERTLADTFRNVEEIAGDTSFKILFATHPLRGKRHS